MISGKLSISVAMCTYNGSAFLSEQLASIAAQTRLPDEVVVCDDGSTDSTPDIVADFARTVPFPVRWIRNEVNLGSTKNFEKAIGLCAGDLIALSDQDDIWMPEKLARQAELFERDPALGGVFSDAELVDDKSQPVGTRLWVGFRFPPHQQKKFREGGAVDVLLKWNVVTGATLMIRASLRAIYTPIPACWHHDGWIAWMAVLYSKLDFIEEPLIRYRIHASQQVGVAAFAHSRKFSLIQRLQLAKREHSARNLAEARDFDQLLRHVAEKAGTEGNIVLPQLQQKVDFLTYRGSPHPSPLVHTIKILRNRKGYWRFECGWRCILGDIVIIFIR